jgi:hypothetical protein
LEVLVRRSRGALLGLLSAIATAGPLEGVGRVSVQPGWRLTPNGAFYASAAAAGLPASGSSPGGPVLASSFAYSATDYAEVAVDLFLGGEQFRLGDEAPLRSVTYGAAAGVRFQQALGEWGPFQEVVPYAGFLIGPTLIGVDGGRLSAMHEDVVTGYTASAGVTARLGETWGVCLEYRFLLARGQVPGVGSINGGGNWLGLGLAWYFPRT